LIDILDLTLEDLRGEFAVLGQPAYRAEQAFAWLYKRGATRFDQFTDFPGALRDVLAARFSVGGLELEALFESRDKTRKFVFRLADGPGIETVLIPAGARRTVCVSTQVGCKFACVFCASGRPGFTRNLRPSEILGQILFLRDDLDAGLTNVVFMGMGEPLDNMDNLEKAIRILNAAEGFGLAARRMTVSTSGIVPGIERLSRMGLQVNLSISLHAATDELRDRLMPVGRKYPLAQLLRACEKYLQDGGRKITLEYVLIAGVNDRPADAEALARVARKLRAKVNLIPYSPVHGLDFKTPAEPARRRFLERLQKAGIASTLRESKGGDIQAACGQLAGRIAPAHPSDSKKG